MAQNIPDLLTVSLKPQVREWMSSGEILVIPAVDHNGVVTSPALHLDDLLYHSNNGLHVSALALWVPVLYVELSHFVFSGAGLKETSPCAVNTCVQHITIPVD